MRMQRGYAHHSRVLMHRSAHICRAARGEAEGWKARTLQAESQIAELKLQVKDYRMQLGLPITDAEGSGAAPAALTWHQPDSRPEIGEPPVQLLLRYSSGISESSSICHGTTRSFDEVSAGCKSDHCQARDCATRALLKSRW